MNDVDEDVQSLVLIEPRVSKKNSKQNASYCVVERRDYNVEKYIKNLAFAIRLRMTLTAAITPIHSLIFTSCATPANLLTANMVSRMLFLHARNIYDNFELKR